MKIRVRIVVQSSDDGNKQYLNVSTDFERPVEDFLFPNCFIDIDEVREWDLPPGFPLEYSFERV